jgi:hypothetical protein
MTKNTHTRFRRICQCCSPRGVSLPQDAQWFRRYSGHSILLPYSRRLSRLTASSLSMLSQTIYTLTSYNELTWRHSSHVSTFVASRFTRMTCYTISCSIRRMVTYNIQTTTNKPLPSSAPPWRRLRSTAPGLSNTRGTHGLSLSAASSTFTKSS